MGSLRDRWWCIDMIDAPLSGTGAQAVHRDLVVLASGEDIVRIFALA